MHYSITKAIGLGILSILLLGSNGNPVSRALVCAGEDCDEPSSINRNLVQSLHGPKPNILPRVVAGGRPGKPNDRGPDGAPLDRPNDPDHPTVPTNQNGEEGGFQGQPETGGGFTGICTRGSRWQLLWRRSGCGPDSSNTVPLPQEGPPSVKNNYLQESTEGEKIVLDRPIDVRTRKEMFEEGIKGLKGVQKGPWLFYSGLKLTEVDSWKGEVDRILGQKTGYIRDLVDIRGPPYMEEKARFAAANADWYFWAANSKAFAQAVEGKVYAVLPYETPINQPYGDKGSNWWSYELPELTRSGKVDSIAVYFPDPMNMDPGAIGDAKIIWQRGDPPLGFPGDERRHYTRPTEPWNE